MPDQRPHILMLCSWFPNRVQPTNGNFVEKHIRLLTNDMRVGVLQVEYDPEMKSGKSRIEATEEDSYPVQTIYFGSRASRLGRLWLRLSWFRWGIQNYIQQHGKPQIVHVHVAMPALLIAYWIEMRYGIPYVLSCHSSGFLPISPRRYPWWQQRLLVWVANRASRVCPVSNALAKAWRQDGLRSPIQVVPNVVDTKLFSPPETRPKAPPLRLLHISNFAPEAKNVDGILRVAARLKAARFPFTLTIAGDGDLATVEATAKQLGLDDQHLQLKGTLSEFEVAEHMRSHHCFILFSNYETQGITAIEAVCCGLPVIATRVGGLPEIIDRPERGFLIEAGDEDELCSVIQSFNPTSIPPPQPAKLPYTRENVKQQLLAVYRHILAGAS